MQLLNRRFVVRLRGRSPIPEDRPDHLPIGEPALLRKGDPGYGTLISQLCFTAELMQQARPVQGSCETETVLVGPLFCPCQRFPALLQGLFRIAQNPQGQCLI